MKKLDEILAEKKAILQESIKTSLEAKMEELVESKKKAKYMKEEKDGDEEDGDEEDGDEEDEDTVNEATISEASRLIGKEKVGSAEAKIYWDSDSEEYQVKFYKNGKFLGDGQTYYTNDKSDAMGTAKAEVKRMQ